MSASFTPGPWRVGADLTRVHPFWKNGDGDFAPENLHRNGYAKTIAAVGKEDGDWRGILQQVADARLIAAAPELLEALIVALEALEMEGACESTCLSCADARKLIAKARGEA